MNSFIAIARLRSTSFLAQTNMTLHRFAFRRSISTSSAWPSSSFQYRSLNRSHLSGLCPNHVRSSGLGAMSLSHGSMVASSLVTPRGHRRSTGTRKPSEGNRSSYMRLSRILQSILQSVTPSWNLDSGIEKKSSHPSGPERVPGKDSTLSRTNRASSRTGSERMALVRAQVFQDQAT